MKAIVSLLRKCRFSSSLGGSASAGKVPCTNYLMIRNENNARDVSETSWAHYDSYQGFWI